MTDQTLNVLVTVGQTSYLEEFVRDMRVVRCALFMEVERSNLYICLATTTVNTCNPVLWTYEEIRCSSKIKDLRLQVISIKYRNITEFQRQQS